VKTNVVSKGQWERELEVEVEASRIDAEVTKAYKNYQKRAEIPGFRKGKVPLRVIKARYGDSIRDEVVYELLPTLLEEATREAGLAPAAPPSISAFEAKPGEDLKFTATLDIWPEIDVTDYEGLHVTRSAHQVADEEVTEQLEELRNRQATERSVERPLANGDVLMADLQRLDDTGVPIIGEKFEERRFTMGEDGAPSPEFEEALLGLSAGEERDIRFAYRDDLPNEELAGTQEHFMVTAREIYERTLPDLDDEFAKDVGEQFQGLDELRQHIRTQIEQRWDYMAQRRLRSEVVEKLIEAHPFELPKSMVTNYVRTMRQRQQQQQQQQQQQGQQQGQQNQPDQQDLNRDPSEEEQQHAEQRLRTYLLIEGVRKKAEVSVSDEDFEAFLVTRAEEMGAKVEDLKRSARVDDLRSELEETKVFELLISKAKVTEDVV
jgi:trigger factor